MGAIIKSPLYVLAWLSLLAGPLRAETNFAAKAESAFRAAQQSYSTNANNLAIAIELARTTFDWAEFAKDNDERESLAQIGMGAARVAVRADANSSPAHYYLALNIGQLARTKMLGALKLISEMERELKRAIEIDPKFDYAGAMRTLGILYMEAPGWPTSVGSKSKSRVLLERTLELAPNYPDTHLTYMEALIKWKDWKTLNESIAPYEKLLPAAQKEFAGEEWEDEWASWNPRWNTILSKRK